MKARLLKSLSAAVAMFATSVPALAAAAGACCVAGAACCIGLPCCL
jgi:hypothetical protein